MSGLASAKGAARGVMWGAETAWWSRSKKRAGGASGEHKDGAEKGTSGKGTKIGQGPDDDRIFDHRALRWSRGLFRVRGIGARDQSLCEQCCDLHSYGGGGSLRRDRGWEACPPTISIWHLAAPRG